MRGGVFVRATVEEKEGGSNLNLDQEDRSTQEKTGNKGVPKKLFRWNEEVRLVFEILPSQKFLLALNNDNPNVFHLQRMSLSRHQ